MKIKIHIILIFLVCFAIVAFAKFCPPPLHPEPCKRDYKYNHCCSQGDCKSYDICCVEPCGNVCRRARDAETSGVAFRNGDECQFGKVNKAFWSSLFGLKEESFSHCRRASTIYM
uniref:U12-Eretoxin-Ek1b_1 n=1 Tax=Eresus cinnaberinus TaxID=175337 RepID=A0A2D0PC41_ERECI